MRPFIFLPIVFSQIPESEALAMLAYVYSLHLWPKRHTQAYTRHNQELNQLGKLTERPTLRWVFQFPIHTCTGIVNVKQISHPQVSGCGFCAFFLMPVGDNIYHCGIRLSSSLHQQFNLD